MDRAEFFAAVRLSLFGGRLSAAQVQGIEAILDEAVKRAIRLEWLAYILATAFHETAQTMQPIAEYGKGKGKKYGVKGKYGQVPYGRGFVQLTWDENYEKADKELGLNGALLKNFDLALQLDIATAILFAGMEEGWFTGKKLSDYIHDAVVDYVNSRRIVNGTDRATMIATYAREFEVALEAAGYAAEPASPGAEPAPAPPKPVPAPQSDPVEPAPKASWVVALVKILTSILGRKAA
jgi:hypothetical protein